MVEISIFCSDIFSGDGSIVGSKNLNTFTEFLEFAKNVWLRCNVSSETHECKAIASAVDAPDGFPKDFGLGLFVFHFNKRKGTHEIFISHTANEEFTEEFDSVGMIETYQNRLSEDNLFRERFEFLNNLNNPHRLLGTWIKKLDDDFDVYDLVKNEKHLVEVSDSLIENTLLSKLLKFAYIQNKAQETLQWLGSKHGSDFLKDFDGYETVATKLSTASVALLKEIGKSDHLDISIKKFIDEFDAISIPEPKLFI